MSEKLKRTNEEAIECLKEIKPMGDHMIQEAIDMAIESLEKQISKKVMSGGYCPGCSCDVADWRIKYCPECGQKLNW